MKPLTILLPLAFVFGIYQVGQQITSYYCSEKQQELVDKEAEKCKDAGENKDHCFKVLVMKHCTKQVDVVPDFSKIFGLEEK